MSAPPVSAAQRRARLATRHFLAGETPSATPVQVAQQLVAYHASDPASVYLAVAARTGFAPAQLLDDALYVDRTLVRTLGMRRTMFVIPTELLPAVQAACTDTIAERERRRTLQMIADSGEADPAGWLDRAQARTVRALATRGEATTAELAADVPELRSKVVLAAGKPYEARATLAPRVLFQLGAEGRVIRGRPVRSWVSNYRWTLAESWFTAPPPAMPAADAEVELARRWLAAFGPGTVADLKWWTGWTIGTTRRALAKLAAVEVDLDGEVGFVLGEDTTPVAASPPAAALLPGLDPTVMGWAMRGRHWYLGDEVRAPLYDRNGNVGPTVWWDGQIIGGWAQRAEGVVVYRLLVDAGVEAAAAVAEQAAQLQEWLGPVRVTPRFRTPLERELTD